MKAKLYIDREFIIGPVDRRLYGSFVEHLGRAVYGGIFEPGHPTADEAGFRGDVLDLVRELDVPVVRYPGGNFVSSFHWEDSIGPQESRPRRLDLAWRAVEPNRFGLAEFIAWTKAAGTAPMMALNLGTRGIEAARGLVEYCNHAGGSYWSDLRRSHGSASPFGIKLWCLGNEMDGPWQVGQKTPDEYGRLAYETAKALKLFDPGLELVACGSSSRNMASFPQWEAVVLDHCYEQVDYISLHQYFKNHSDDLPTFLADSIGMDSFIETVASTCDFVQAKHRGKKVVNLSFDEWNVWYHSEEADRKLEPWTVGPPQLEDIYTFEDALVVGCMINSLLRHADRVKIACLAQLVNVIAPIMTRNGGGAWRQTIFWPFALASRYGRGISLSIKTDVGRYKNSEYGDVPYLDVSGVLNGDELSLFVVNRHPTEAIAFELHAAGLERLHFLECHELKSADLKAVNDEAHPDRIKPRRTSGKNELVEEATLSAAPLTWNLYRFRA